MQGLDNFLSNERNLANAMPSRSQCSLQAVIENTTRFPRPICQFLLSQQQGCASQEWIASVQDVISKLAHHNCPGTVHKLAEEVTTDSI